VCYEEGILQAYLDGELDESQEEQVKKHLETCPRCSEVLDELKKLDEFAKEKLALDFYPSKEILKRRLKRHIVKEGVKNMIKKYGKMVAGFAAAALVFSAVVVSPVRYAVADFLGVFRVSRIEAVKITMEDIEEIKRKLEEGGIGEIDLEQLGKFRTTGGGYEDIRPDEVQSVAKKVDFDVRLFSELEGYKLEYVGIGKPVELEITPDVKGINKLITAFGGEKTLPKDVDGKTFVIRTEGMVRQIFVRQDENGNYKSLSVTQVGIPEIQVPEGVDMNAIREAILELPVLPDNIRRQLVGIEDWQNTLPIPVDAEATEVESITVKGKPATLVKTRWGNDLNCVLLWADDETVVTLEGSLSQEEMLKIAQVLR